MLEREAKKTASENLRPMNQGLELVGSATRLNDYLENTYKKVELPLLAKTTLAAYQTHLDKYVIPAFGEFSIRELTPKEALSSVLGSAKKYGLLTSNPVEGISIPTRRG